MNTIEIRSALESLPQTNKIFFGVFPSDDLPEKIPVGCVIVANTDPKNAPGSILFLFFTIIIIFIMAII